MMKARGFTLIEFVMVIAITGIIISIINATLNQGFLAYLASKNLIDADWQGRLALARMSRDLHGVRSASDISTATASSIVFTNASGTTETYQVSGTTLTLNGQTLANGVQSFSLSYYNQTGASTGTPSAIRYVTVNLTISLNNTHFNLTTSVNLRNLL
jgi:prepilin-type N-terminal cleavage/methylation domain-containing protein